MIKVRDRFSDMFRFKGGVRFNCVIIDVTKDIQLSADILSVSTETWTSKYTIKLFI